MKLMKDLPLRGLCRWDDPTSDTLSGMADDELESEDKRLDKLVAELANSTPPTHAEITVTWSEERKIRVPLDQLPEYQKLQEMGATGQMKPGLELDRRIGEFRAALRRAADAVPRSEPIVQMHRNDIVTNIGAIQLWAGRGTDADQARYEVGLLVDRIAEVREEQEKFERSAENDGR